MLYIVATPIGNLEDITYRAVRILSEVDVILCEDTRMTSRLLQEYDIKAKTTAYHARSGEGKEDQIVERLVGGEIMAMVTDAGTPGISDPGSRLVSKAREAGVQVVPIPGAVAVVTALQAAGVPTNEFEFLGFIPHKKGRQTKFKHIAETNQTVVFYESPHRILKALQSLDGYCPDKKVVIARELTKIHEEFLYGTAVELTQILEENPVKQKGEFVVIVN